ncbi:MAG: LPS assembly lipoprotein LptE, partial [Paludibacteraceae bacterium]|nr:LPS assembly lipoprotein LptE [Paludibacteraceae bacterium]
SLSPSAINSSGSSTMTRLTVVVKVVFVNRSNSSENFERNFSSYQEFSNTQTINQVQEELCETIINELIDQIFNATVANW